MKWDVVVSSNAGYERRLETHDSKDQAERAMKRHARQWRYPFYVDMRPRLSSVGTHGRYATE